ncbi:MAG: hypothetical protein ACLFUB_11955 [Cyclobacteriaceae bacterium]
MGIYLEGDQGVSGFKHYLHTDKAKSPEYLHDFIVEALHIVEQLEEE